MQSAFSVNALHHQSQPAESKSHLALLLLHLQPLRVQRGDLQVLALL